VLYEEKRNLKLENANLSLRKDELSRTLHTNEKQFKDARDRYNKLNHDMIRVEFKLKKLENELDHGNKVNANLKNQYDNLKTKLNN